MPAPFIMPKVDMDQESARIVSWLKHEGDIVKADETVLVVETDKVAIDVPAPASGILAGVRAIEGQIVPVTQVIAYILKEESLDDVLQKNTQTAEINPTQPSTPQLKGRAREVSPVATRMAKELGVDLARIPSVGDRLTKSDIERYIAQTTRSPSYGTIRATPAARRLEREFEIDIRTIQGSGPLGRIQAKDVLDAKQGRESALTQRPQVQEPLIGAISGVTSEYQAEIQPLVGMRETIANRMQKSFHDVPHIALTIEVDMTCFEATRARMNERATRQEHGGVSLTALLVRIIGWALERHPALNASLLNGSIYFWKDVNIGVATAIPEGLIVPVIQNANHKSISEIVANLQDLTSRAREGKLTMKDVQHGTFTITNLGMFGIPQFRAIINPPECAILAVGAVVRKPVVINEQDEVAVRPIIALTLSADHRVIDGVIAARFLAELSEVVEYPDLILY